MINENQKNTGKNEALDALEGGMQLAFKNAEYEKVRSLALDIKAIDPENQIVKQLLSKLDAEQPAQDKAKKAEKVKEYENMLRILNKQRDYKKIKSLAQELKSFDPSNKAADKWINKADRKLLGKGLLASIFSKKPAQTKPVEKKGEPVPNLNLSPTSAPVEASKATVKAPESQANLKTPAAISPSPVPKPEVRPTPPSLPVESLSSKEDVAEKKALEEKEPTPAPTKKALGNTFTRMFGGGDSKGSGSIIDKIVEKTDQKKAKDVQKTPFNWLKFARGMMNVTMVFILFTAGFLYLSLDPNNTVLGFFGIEQNTGSNLHAAAEVLSNKETEVEVLKKEIEVYKSGYNDADIALVQSIIDKRIDWPDTFEKIKEVTNSVYDLNDFFNYVEYNNYSLDTDNKTVRLSGTLTDPLGRNLTKLVELEEAFKYYPKDKNNPNDTTKPYFTDLKEMTSFSKSLDEETGRFMSSFQLSFAFNEAEDDDADQQE